MHIILAHGVLGFDRLAGLEYFNGVKKHLEDTRDVTVTTTEVAAVGRVSTRAEALAGQIAAVPGDEKVHIFAHSMGGLDARYAIAKNLSGIAARVAALVTIGTPYLGSVVANRLEHSEPEGGVVPIAVGIEIRQEALHDLTTSEATRLTHEAEDRVPTYCIAGDTQRGANGSVIFNGIAEKFGVEDPSDGVVTVGSATAVGRPLGTWHTDHAGLVGWNLNHPIPVVFEVPGISNHLHPHLEWYGKLVDFFRRQQHA
jgi:triacylglycerol lipase